MELTEFQSAAISASLQKMFRGSYFDFCTVRDIAKLLDRSYVTDTPEGQALRLLHCVSWSNMSAKLRDDVVTNTLQLLGLNMATVDEVEPEPARKSGFFGRFLG